MKRPESNCGTPTSHDLGWLLDWIDAYEPAPEEEDMPLRRNIRLTALICDLISRYKVEEMIDDMLKTFPDATRAQARGAATRARAQARTRKRS